MSIGKTGFGLVAVASSDSWDGSMGKPEIRAEFVMFSKDSKLHFEKLNDSRTDLDAAFTSKPTWYSDDHVQQCKVFFRKSEDWRDEGTRADCYKWLVDHLDRLHEVFQPRIQQLS